MGNWISVALLWNMQGWAIIKALNSQYADINTADK
jgi:hypothetical protein